MKHLLLVLVCACGGGDEPPRDPHVAGTCDSSWTQNGYTDCQAGCANASAALGAKGPACDGTIGGGSDGSGSGSGSGSAFTCTHTFDFDGQTGCCASDKPRVLWVDCP